MENIAMEKLTLSDEDFEKLRCNKCNEYLNRAPIMAFLEMENYLECGRCFDEEATKAKGLRPLRNKPLEILASLTFFPCKNAKNGCTERRTWPDIEEHEKECVLKWIHCIFPTLDIGEFKGTLDDFKKYIKEKCPKLFIDDGLLQNNFNEAFENYYFMFQSNVLFCVRVKCDITKGKVWFNVCVLEDKTDNEYCIEFSSETSKTSFIIKHPCVISLEDFLDLDKAFELNLEAIRQLLKIPNDMMCKIFVNRKFSTYHTTELLKEIQCPVCWELMHEKIFMCKNGHNVCTVCKSLVTQCPECREEDVSIRNLSMEKLIAHSFLPCKNYNSGCTYIGIITELIYHLKHCKF